MQSLKFLKWGVFRPGLGWSLLHGCVVWCLGSDALGQDSSKVFRAGTQIIDITPTGFPVLVNAMFTERTSTNVADRLHVRALVLDDGSTRLAMAVVDSCMVARDLIDRAKELAARQTGIPTSRMLVSSTHTHSAPSAMGCLGSRMDTNYARFLEPRIAEAIIGAAKNLTRARVGWGAVEDWEHTFNRRWIRRPDRMLTDPFGQASVRAHMHPGHESPDAVGPSGPVDPGLSVLAVQTAEGEPLAVLANYSQHYYGSPLVSSDYYGRFCGYMARLMKADSVGSTNRFLAIMSQGTSGDLMWMDYSAPARDVGYDAYAKALAEKAAKLVQGLTFQEWVPLAMAERTLELGYRTPSPERLVWARRIAAQLNGRLPGTLPEVYALESIMLHERPRTELKIQALRIGGLGIAALPNEVFALTGLKLKAQSPLGLTFNIELANGAEGYIPPPEQHRLGGYTTWPARTAGLEEQAEPRILETALSLLEEVSGKPRRPMVQPPGAYTKAVLDSKPAAFWRLNESAIPTAFDASGHGRSATYESGVALYLPGASGTVGFQPPQPETPNAFSADLINRAPHFAGGRLRAELPLGAGAYSVEFWMWNGLPASARSVTGCLFSRGRDAVYGAPGEHLSIGGTRQGPGRLIFSNGGSDLSQSLVGRTELPIRTWSHVVLVRDGKRVTVYLNGDPVPEISGDLEVGRVSESDLLFFGGRSDKGISFEGKLDEISWYDRAMDPGEARAHFKASGIQPPVPAGTPAVQASPSGVPAWDSLKPLAHWLAPQASDRSLLGRAGQPNASAENGVSLPAADSSVATFSGGRVQASGLPLGSTYTVGFWFLNETPNSARPVTAYLFSRGEDGAEGAPGDHLGIGGSYSHAGKLIVFNGNLRDELLAGKTVITPGTWHQVVLVREARRVRVYLDGGVQPEIDGDLEPGCGPEVDQIFFGGRSDRFAPLQGKLSDLVILNRSLKSQELLPVLRKAAAVASGREGQAAATSAPTPEAPSSPLSPEASLRKIHVPAGFQAELVASEPLLESPVAIDWDGQGRLWVVEMVDYPLGLDGKGEPGGRVRMLEDLDGDGRYDKTTLFAEKLSFPTGILCWRDGVLITAAPEILFLKDTDGDGRADVREVLLSGFFEGNQQLRVNGLRWGVDNWVYCASGAHHGGYGAATKIRSHRNGQEYAIGSRDFRFNPDTGDLQAESGPSQFGRNPDDWGNWFGVQNSWPLWHYVMPDRYLRRNPHVAAPSPVHQVVTPGNPRVFPASPREKRFHSFGESGHFTSACSAMIYRDQLLFPESGALGDPSSSPRHAFTCEPFHNLVQHNLVTEEGPSFAATRVPGDGSYDFFASEDRWCRPVMVRTGPDGALWVVDMYRYMIEHPEWLPSEGKAELLPHYRLGAERGRVYRVFRQQAPARRVPALNQLTSAQLAEVLQSPNGWLRDKAQMMLLWRSDRGVVAALETLAQRATNEVGRIHALGTLEGLRALRSETVLTALRDACSGVRIQALRLAEDHEGEEVIAEVSKWAALPVSAKEALQLAFTLGQWKDVRAGRALGQIAVARPEDPFVFAAVLSSALPHLAQLVEAVVLRGGDCLDRYSEPLMNLCLATASRDSLAQLLAPALRPAETRPGASQMQFLGRFLEVLARRQTTVSSLHAALQSDDLGRQLARFDQVFLTAKELAGDRGATAADRLEAAALLARDPRYRSEAVALLGALLSPQIFPDSQRRALQALGVTGEAGVPDVVFKAWPLLGPEVRLAALDELLAREPWAGRLLKAIESGTIRPAAFDAARRGRLLRHPSAEIKDRAKKVFLAGGSLTRPKVIESFRPALALEGDAGRGTAVFARLCQTCHRMGGVGSDIGPNLQSVANHPPEKLLVSILDPNASIEPGFTAYTASLTNGEEVYGLIAAETGNSLVFKLPDGKTRSVLRSELASLGGANLSLMPEGLEEGMSRQDLADLIRYLRSPTQH